MIGRLVIALLLITFAVPNTAFAEGSPAEASATGAGIMVVGPDPYNFESNEPINGTITIKVKDKGDRQSPLQNIDEVDVKAQFSAPDGDYDITIKEPLLGHEKQPTWFGVGLDKKMHGNTNTGTRKLPKMEPDITVWGWAEILKNGEIIHRKVPAQVKVKKDEPLKGVTLEIETEKKSLADTPDGYLEIRWDELDQLALPVKQERTKQIIAFAGLIFLNVWFGWLASQEPQKHTSANSSGDGS
ncbi:MAG: hypothetical protein HQP61_10185 [Peptococcaceae bacterium]|nr:hypothetical protein [Candidatus Syntrophopropionicum ammoniitolerans]